MNPCSSIISRMVLWEWGYDVLWMAYLRKVFLFVFGASSHIKEKSTKRRAQFMSMLCVVYEILYVTVCIWEPDLVPHVIAAVVLMVICCIFIIFFFLSILFYYQLGNLLHPLYIISRTRFTMITNLLFIYGTTAWNLYMVMYVFPLLKIFAIHLIKKLFCSYTARSSEVSTPLRLVGLPFSTILVCRNKYFVCFMPFVKHFNCADFHCCSCIQEFLALSRPHSDIRSSLFVCLNLVYFKF